MIEPDWPAPARVRALVTTRPMGDMAGAGRNSLNGLVPGEPVWLTQVHGTAVIDLDEKRASVKGDAAITRAARTVCAVGAADCMPVLLADERGAVVAAVHAGWRGLSAGVIEAAVRAMAIPPGRILAWLGPAIGPRAYEVGEDVREAFASHPDAFSAPNLLPADFFNVNSPRGAVFATSGSGFQVSANVGVAPIEFDNINPTYSSLFTIFSPQRLFTALGSKRLTVQFFEPGSTTPATTSGFGAVFTDVDRPGTKIAYFDAIGDKLATFDVPVSPGSETLSFLGVRFLEDRVAMVRITSGTSRLGANEMRGRDLVVMDDFIYGEPTP